MMPIKITEINYSCFLTGMRTSLYDMYFKTKYQIHVYQTCMVTMIICFATQLFILSSQEKINIKFA